MSQLRLAGLRSGYVWTGLWNRMEQGKCDLQWQSNGLLTHLTFFCSYCMFIVPVHVHENTRLLMQSRCSTRTGRTGSPAGAHQCAQHNIVLSVVPVSPVPNSSPVDAVLAAYGGRDAGGRRQVGGGERALEIRDSLHELPGYDLLSDRRSSSSTPRAQGPPAGPHLTSTCLARADTDMPAPPPTRCKANWTLYGDRCYRAFGDERISWSAARLACGATGDNLVSVHSVFGQSYVQASLYNQPQDARNSGFWIGLNSLAVRLATHCFALTSHTRLARALSFCGAERASARVEQQVAVLVRVLGPA